MKLRGHCAKVAKHVKRDLTLSEEMDGFSFCTFLLGAILKEG